MPHIEIVEDVVDKQNMRAAPVTFEALACHAVKLTRIAFTIRYSCPIVMLVHDSKALAQVHQVVKFLVLGGDFAYMHTRVDVLRYTRGY